MNECKALMNEAEVEALLEESICEMTNRIAKISLRRTMESNRGTYKCNALLLKIAGDYEALLLLYVEDTLLVEIVRNMKRGEVSDDEEAKVYIIEYYNILCGYFVSHFNQRQGLKARFGIPQIVRGGFVENNIIKEEQIKLCYESRYGRAEFYYIKSKS